MSFFPTTVLVGVDGTPASRHALAVAAELCLATSSPLHLVHVKLRSGLIRGRPMNPPQRERTDQEAQELLERESDLVTSLGAEVAGTHVRYAERVHEAFVAVQDELAAGLLVLGERGSGSLARMLSHVGPSSTGAVRRSRASVLVVREDPRSEPSS
jgi:nucleotide-binding universal stress UspA family protein